MDQTADTGATCMLVSVAIRMIRILGLDVDPGNDCNGIEATQQRHVVWVAYMLDLNLSIRSGLPPALTEGTTRKGTRPKPE